MAACLQHPRGWSLVLGIVTLVSFTQAAEPDAAAGPELRPADGTPLAAASPKPWLDLSNPASTGPVVPQAMAAADAPVPANVIYVRLSRSFLEKYLCKNVDRTSEVRDNILGADVTGACRTTGRTELELLPDPQAAQVRLLFRGEANFQTVGVTGPVQIHSQGVTRFVSQKQLWVDGLEVRQSDPLTEAETNTTTLDITSDLPPIADRIARRIAFGQEARTHAEAEAISNERTKQKVERAFDQVVRDYTAAFTKELKSQYARLPIEGRFAIREIRCSTTPDMLEIVVLGRGDRQQPIFAAAPGTDVTQPDVEVHIHSALVGKAIVNPEMRDAVASAVKAVIASPLATSSTAQRHVTNFRGPVEPAPDQQFSIRWPEAEGSKWLSIAWHASPRTEGRQIARPVEPPR